MYERRNLFAICVGVFFAGAFTGVVILMVVLVPVVIQAILAFMLWG